MAKNQPQQPQQPQGGQPAQGQQPQQPAQPQQAQQPAQGGQPQQQSPAQARHPDVFALAAGAGLSAGWVEELIARYGPALARVLIQLLTEYQSAGRGAAKP